MSKITDEDVGITVYGIYREWFSVRLDGEDVWLKREPRDRYRDYHEFFDADGGLSYLRSDLIEVADYPGGPTRKVLFAPLDGRENLQGLQPAIEVVGRAVLQDFEVYDTLSVERYCHSHTIEYWLKITLPEFTCADEAVVAQGEFDIAWVRARDENDEYTVGFISGGC